MPYVSLQQMLNEASPPGRYHYRKSNFLWELTDDAIATLAECAAMKPSPYSAVWLEHLHGAAARVEPTATAFAHRPHAFHFAIFSQWLHRVGSEPNIAWTRQCWDAMRTYMAEGVYVNYLEEEGDPRERITYGQNYERLSALKRKYDPANLFRVNNNVLPASSAGDSDA